MNSAMIKPESFKAYVNFDCPTFLGSGAVVRNESLHCSGIPLGNAHVRNMRKGQPPLHDFGGDVGMIV